MPDTSRTPWFSSADEPVREGIYEVQLFRDWRVVRTAWRDGSWWLPSARFCKPNRLHLRRWPEFRWRGLMAKPEPVEV